MKGRVPSSAATLSRIASYNSLRAWPSFPPVHTSRLGWFLILYIVLTMLLIKTFPCKGQSGEPLNSPCVSPVIQKSCHINKPYLSAASKNISGGATPPPHIRTRLIFEFLHKCNS